MREVSGKVEVDLMPMIRMAVFYLYRMSLRNNTRSQHNYKKIIAELYDYEGPAYDLKELRRLKYVGERTIKMIQRFIDKRGGDGMKTLDELKSHSISKKVQEETNENSVERGRRLEADIESVFECAKKRMDVGKRYIPGYRTKGYAIMKALWIRDGLTKYGMVYFGEQYCDSGFDVVSDRSVSLQIKALIKGGLIYKEGRSKFYLTGHGRKTVEMMFANTSIIERKCMEIVLIVDSREMKSKKHRTFFQRYFESKEIVCETRMLELGDFLWIKDERMCGVIVERKRGVDFVSSITDGRFSEQKCRLKKCGLKRIFYVVEDLRAKHMLGIGRNFAMSCLTMTKLEGFTVVETENIVETGMVIHMIDTHVRNDKKENLYETNDLDSRENFRDRNTMDMSYGSFINLGTKEKNKDPSHLFYLSLLSIRGIGHKKASALAKHYKSIGGFMNSIKSFDGDCELYSFEGDGGKLTKKGVRDIIELFFK